MAKLCGKEGCDNPYFGRGLCRLHDWRLRVHGSVDWESTAAIRAASQRRSVSPDGETKRCATCHQWLPIDQFGKDRNHWSGHTNRCRVCKAAEQRAIPPERNRRNRLKSTYGMSVMDYERLFAAQDGRCAICRTSNPGSRGFFDVDHDHATMRVRGLLCHHCNKALGHLNDDVTRFRAAIDYLTSG